MSDRNLGLSNLITNEDREVLHELHRLINIIKPKYFSLGRDMNKFQDLINQFGKPKEEPKVKIESVVCSGVVGNTLVTARQTVITRG